MASPEFMIESDVFTRQMISKRWLENGPGVVSLQLAWSAILEKGFTVPL